MKNKNLDFDKIYDLIGLRIITNTTEECYEVLGCIHNLWQPIPSRLKDYIANPKPNFYQSLHTGVLNDDKQRIEIQIRTKEMDDIAEAGIAAHWKYKGIKSEARFDKRLNWLKQILDFGSDHPSKFMKNLKVDLFGDNIFVFTPHGMVVELPNKATPVDFAYGVHSDVGEKCSGARVNGRFVSLRYELDTGDVVEILTSKTHKPSRDWLKFVRSSKALNKIKHSLRLYQGIPAKSAKILKENEEISTDILFVKGMKNFGVKFSSCCDPLPGDNLMGYSNSMKNKVIVHKIECSNLRRIKKELLDVQWLKNFNRDLKLRINALDRVGLFADILNTVATTGTKVDLANAKSVDEYNSECILSIRFDGIGHLRDVIDRINKIADVKRIRIE
jgi:(p)ppGpp synthase/HD superfamily hydrolase